MAWLGEICSNSSFLTTMNAALNLATVVMLFYIKRVVKEETK